MTPTTEKRVRDLKPGDIVQGEEEGVWFRVRRVTRSKLFSAAGGCFCLDMTATREQDRTERISDQHYPGDMTVAVRV